MEHIDHKDAMIAVGVVVVLALVALFMKKSANSTGGPSATGDAALAGGFTSASTIYVPTSSYDIHYETNNGTIINTDGPTPSTTYVAPVTGTVSIPTGQHPSTPTQVVSHPTPPPTVNHPTPAPAPVQTPAPPSLVLQTSSNGKSTPATITPPHSTAPVNTATHQISGVSTNELASELNSHPGSSLSIGFSGGTWVSDTQNHSQTGTSVGWIDPTAIKHPWDKYYVQGVGWTA